MTAKTIEKRDPEEGRLAMLRAPFPENQISKLPKPTKAQTDEVRADFKKGIRCTICGAWHHPNVVHLDYVGHAALTDRLLDTDAKWSWEPLALTEVGLPAFDPNGGLWIKLTVENVTRLGYGSADGKSGGDAIKEIIGDALRNAAMRFGAALDLWHKGDLHADNGEDQGQGQNGAVSPDPPAKSAPAKLTGIHKTRAALKDAIQACVTDMKACSDRDMLVIVMKDNAPTINQCREEHEYWWNGDGMDFIGLSGEIAEAYKRFDPELIAHNPITDAG